MHFNSVCLNISHFTEITSLLNLFFIELPSSIYPKACHTVSLESDLVGFC